MATFVKVPGHLSLTANTPRTAVRGSCIMAVLRRLVGFTHLIAGFDNPTLVASAPHTIRAAYTSRQAT